jgi:hypothetical protein
MGQPFAQTTGMVRRLNLLDHLWPLLRDYRGGVRA